MALLGSASRPTAVTSPLRHRLGFLVALVFIAFGVLFARLWNLQVVRGEEYYRQTRRNVVGKKMLPSVRGKILDFHGLPIADNRASFSLYGSPVNFDAEALETVYSGLELGDEEREKFANRLAKGRERDPKIEINLLSDQPRARAALVRQEPDRFSFFRVVDEPTRIYPNGSALAHVVGYMNQINAKELGEREAEGYGATDLVGRYGLERRWESYLRGKRGFERFVVNAKGERIEGPDTDDLIEGARYVPPVSGHNVILTIDLELQKAVEEALQSESAGAVAVVEVGTGRILALASTPSFDPNIMSGRLTRKLEQQMVADPRKPFVDKSLRQTYPPGSTYKFVTALAGLEDRLVSVEEPLTCTGAHRTGGRLFRCTGSHEKVDLLDAIEHSCNVYFWKLSERVGLDSMSAIARQFGFGEPTGLGLNGDSKGRVPTRQWYEERDVFKVGHTLNASTGQGDVEVTVLQLAMAYAAIANGRRLFVPYLVDRVESANGEVVVESKPQLRRMVEVEPDAMSAVKQGMWRVVNSPGGTAYSYARSNLIEYSGKTGTAQVRAMRRRDDDENLTDWQPERDHAWFAGYAPSENPEVSFVVLLEHGGSGGKNAGPVGKSIVEAYARLREQRQKGGKAGPEEDEI